ncbi:BLUF domain-containing protein [Zunongwangia sp. H14]|uniref:BLUF domain-containing protein n=1 Tax=Zunongwangia sp. H14 TaxID=3240792 RepID=UPI003562AE42
MSHAICYVSTANPELNDEDIEEVLNWSKNWNNSHQITGILLYSEGNFFQVLEGKHDILTDLFQNIRKDKRHHSLIKIFEKEIKKEAFTEYEVDFVSERTKFNEEALKFYLDSIQNLDATSQKVVENMLNALIFSNR